MLSFGSKVSTYKIFLILSNIFHYGQIQEADFRPKEWYYVQYTQKEGLKTRNHCYH